MQARAHLQVGLRVREGRHAASRIPHELSPETCQLRKPQTKTQVAPACLMHTYTLQVQAIRAGDEKR